MVARLTAKRAADSSKDTIAAIAQQSKRLKPSLHTDLAATTAESDADQAQAIDDDDDDLELDEDLELDLDDEELELDEDLDLDLDSDLEAQVDRDSDAEDGLDLRVDLEVESGAGSGSDVEVDMEADMESAKDDTGNDEAEDILAMTRENRSVKKQKEKPTAAGLFDAITTLLGRPLSKTDTKKPILSLQKHLTKTLNQAKVDSRASRLKVLERKLALEKDRVVLSEVLKGDLSGPVVDELNYEKSLRKIATRGVVKLFNAIKVAKKGAEEQKSQSVTRTDKAIDVSKTKFLSLLQANPSVQPPSQSDPASKSQPEPQSLPTSKSHAPSSTKFPIPATTVAPKTSTDPKEPTPSLSSSQWNIFKDDYGMTAGFKDWDKESDD